MDLLRSLMSVLETLNQGVHVVDEKGVTVVYNRAASEMDGLSEQEVIGKSLLEVFPSLDQDSSTLLRVLRTGIPQEAKQQTFTNYKGKRITTINFTNPVMLDGKIVGACEVSTDITRMKEMAETILDLQRELHGKDVPGRSTTRKDAQTAPRRLYTVDDIIGESASMKDVKSRALQVAAADTGVLVWGETGTGKELLVQAIHSASARAHGPFVPQNSAALPESLLEGLVFGTVRGGFTGSTDRPGLLELASGGTLYLDEIDSMPAGLQAKLLRVLQDKRVRRLGDTRERPVDVRIVASTSMRPSEAVERGLLRADLYYRISVVEIGLPPLRERHEDIPLLCDHFLRKRSGASRQRSVSPQVMAAFLAYDWPGNVRELEHAIEGSLAFAKGPMIGLDDLPAAVRGIMVTASAYRQEKPRPQVRRPQESQPQESQSQDQQPQDRLPRGRQPRERIPIVSASTGLKDVLRESEREAITKALNEGGSVSGAARILGIPRQTLQYRMKVLGISGTGLA
ncbi:MAG: sigma-54 interaction domain-containing protein [Bacillota bacterium]